MRILNFLLMLGFVFAFQAVQAQTSSTTTTPAKSCDPSACAKACNKAENGKMQGTAAVIPGAEQVVTTTPATKVKTSSTPAPARGKAVQGKGKKANMACDPSQCDPGACKKAEAKKTE
ncbi:MAG: hypothetical protein H6555_00200 [Lewinellaceae bacterium]|nr:hypothetical protein [Lewinellaceae bacterium]